MIASKFERISGTILAMLCVGSHWISFRAAHGDNTLRMAVAIFAMVISVASEILAWLWLVLLTLARDAVSAIIILAVALFTITQTVSTLSITWAYHVQTSNTHGNPRTFLLSALGLDVIGLTILCLAIWVKKVPQWPRSPLPRVRQEDYQTEMTELAHSPRGISNLSQVTVDTALPRAHLPPASNTPRVQTTAAQVHTHPQHLKQELAGNINPVTVTARFQPPNLPARRTSWPAMSVHSASAAQKHARAVSLKGFSSQTQPAQKPMFYWY